LRLRTGAHFERHERIGHHEVSAALTTLKQQPETTWLNEVSSVPLQQALRHLDKAFRSVFEGRAKYRIFKQRRGGRRPPLPAAPSPGIPRRALTRAKMGAPLEIQWSRSFTGAPSTVTVS